MNLGEAFARGVARNPNHLALVDGERRLTWSEWDLEVRRLAGGLRAAGLKRGDHLVTVLSNRAETATLYWACQMLGLIFTPFNWRAAGAEINFVVDDSEAKMVVFEDRSGTAISEHYGITPPGWISLDDGSGWEKLLAAAAVAGPTHSDTATIGLMLYTSGTTGRPKGVPRSHRAELAAAVSCIAGLGYGAHQSQLGVMPLFHTMGMRTTVMSALLGGPLYCMATFDAGAALELIAAEHIGALFLVPTLFHDLVSHPDITNTDLGSVNNIAYAGMSMTSDLTARCQETFRPTRFSNFYGSSEIFTFAICDHVADKPGCAGRAGIGQELRVVRADPAPTVGPGELVAPGEAGEIIATMASPEAFAGYWKRADADAKSIRDGWYFTGDLGYFDQDGELYVIGRVDDMIISGGENIHPEEVEDVLSQSPLVRQAAVIGEPHERWGEQVVAYIEAAAPADAETLDAHCLASDLADFKRPRRYEFVDTLPRSAAGKLLRRQLRRQEIRGHNT